ncbi:MAG TPA: hypothetical protein DHW49_12090 [Anaerolineae bacterium]|nr:hypothetical protein [Anaerolineae bacterium]
MTSDAISKSRISWRVTCFESSENLAIHIFTPKRIDFFTVLLIILGGWIFIFSGGASVQLKGSFDPSFLCVGIAIIFFPLYAILWNLVGKEVIIINKEKIVVKQVVFGIGFKQTYQLSLVSNLRGSLIDPAPFTLEKNMHDWGFAGGSVAFNYKGRDCRFGLLLSKENADVLAAKINQYLVASANSFSSSTVKA